MEAPTLEELQRWRSRMGPKLRALVRSQQDKHPPVRCISCLSQCRRVKAYAAVALAKHMQVPAEGMLIWESNVSEPPHSSRRQTLDQNLDYRHKRL